MAEKMKDDVTFHRCAWKWFGEVKTIPVEELDLSYIIKHCTWKRIFIVVLGGKLQLKKEMNRKSGNGYGDSTTASGKSMPPVSKRQYLQTPWKSVAGSAHQVKLHRSEKANIHLESGAQVSKTCRFYHHVNIRCATTQKIFLDLI